MQSFLFLEHVAEASKILFESDPKSSYVYTSLRLHKKMLW